MFVLFVLKVLLILQPLATYSQNSTSSTAIPANNTEVSKLEVKVIKINVDTTTTTTATTKPEEIVDVEGGTVHLDVSTVKSTLDLPVTPTNAANIKTHSGREGVSESVLTVEGVNNLPNETYSSTTAAPDQNKSVSVLSEHHSNKQINTLDDEAANATHSKIVPKKGVNFSDMPPKYNVSTTETTAISPSTIASKVVTISAVSTTTKPRPKKPTVTIGGDDDEQPYVVLKTQKNNNSTPKVPTIENYEKSKQHNKSTFVIPIVVVILSVPLVAIIINVVYKRGKEWWTHRHYSRMDFLIDGMYNN